MLPDYEQENIDILREHIDNTKEAQLALDNIEKSIEEYIAKIENAEYILQLRQTYMQNY